MTVGVSRGRPERVSTRLVGLALLATLTLGGCGQSDTPDADEPVVIVAHGGPLRAIAGHLLGLPPERWLGLDFGCGQVTRLDVENWGVVLRWFNR